MAGLRAVFQPNKLIRVACIWSAAFNTPRFASKLFFDARIATVSADRSTESAGTASPVADPKEARCAAAFSSPAWDPSMPRRAIAEISTPDLIGHGGSILRENEWR